MKHLNPIKKNLTIVGFVTVIACSVAAVNEVENELEADNTLSGSERYQVIMNNDDGASEGKYWVFDFQEMSVGEWRDPTFGSNGAIQEWVPIVAE